MGGMGVGVLSLREFFLGGFHLGDDADHSLMSLVFLWALHLETSSSVWHGSALVHSAALGGLTDPGGHVGGAVSRGMGVVPAV
jgi:hypothetical protein